MRIVIAEDGALFRDGLAMLLERSGHEVVAAVGSGDELLDAALAHAPDVAIVDIRMPSRSGIDGAQAAVALRDRLPGCAVLLLSQHVELRHCRDLIGTSGFGYLLKDRVLDVTEFDDAIRRVAAGGTALDRIVVRGLVQASGPSGLASLTARELDVLERAAQGLSNAAIASELHLSERTVETHIRSIFVKLGLLADDGAHRRVQAVITYLREHGSH